MSLLLCTNQVFDCSELSSYKKFALNERSVDFYLKFFVPYIGRRREYLPKLPKILGTTIMANCTVSTAV